MAGSWYLNGFYDSSRLTGLFEAAQRRQSVRSFAAAPTADQWGKLLAAADSLAMPGVRIALGICDNSLFQPLMGILMKFENVQRFAAILTTDDQPRSIVNAGVSGEMFLLQAVEMGLGGCWVTGTYKRGQVGIKPGPQEKIVALMALGVPRTQPEPPLTRKRKPIAELCPDFEALPPALKEVAQYVRIAPSAMNMQPWRMKSDAPQSLTVSVGLGAQRLDLGIGMCHAVLALGMSAAMFTLDDSGQNATIALL